VIAGETTARGEPAVCLPGRWPPSLDYQQKETKGISSMKRADEELCRAQFDTFMKKFFTPSQVTWEEVAQQNEPPDYYLLLGTMKFAVEVTTLIETVSVGTLSALPHSVIRRFFQEFVDEVETIAKTKGYLQGDYLVSFSTPIESFAVVQDVIRAKLLEYIQNTNGFDEAPLEVVFERSTPQQRPQQCGIQKVGSELNRIVAGGPVWAKWEGEAAQDICDLLRQSLGIKADKLKDIAHPKILLLLDEYRFADQQMYQKCVPHLSLLASFHTIFVVQSYRRGFPLHSQNHNWLAVCRSEKRRP
jgi:hypothetical protein